MLSRMLSCGGGRQDMSTSTRCVTMQHVVVQNYRMQTAWLPNPRFEKGWTRSMFRKKKKQNKCSSLSTFPSAFQKAKERTFECQLHEKRSSLSSHSLPADHGAFHQVSSLEMPQRPALRRKCLPQLQNITLVLTQATLHTAHTPRSGVKLLLFDFQEFSIKIVGTTFANSYSK